MSQDGLLLLLLKVVLLAGAASTTAFIARYHQMTRGAVWHDELGKTIVIKDILLVLMLLPTILSLFFSFSRLTSHIAAWTDIVLFGLLTPVMLWRLAVWQRIHNGRQAQEARPEQTGEFAAVHEETAEVPENAEGSGQS